MPDLAPPTPVQPKTVRDQIIADARSLPELVAKAQKVDPDLAKQLTGKSLWSAKSPPATIVAAAITWLSAKYGIGLDDGTVGILTLVVGAVAAYAMRAVTSIPIATWFAKPKKPGC